MINDYANKALDGTTHHLTMYTNKAYSEDVPFKDFDYTYLKITNIHHDVNLINKNFINITAQLKMTPKSDITFETKFYHDGTTREDLANAIAGGTETDLIDSITPGSFGKKMYIGWKNSPEIIQEMTVYNNGHETGYQQVYSDRESYLEATKYMTCSDKDLKRDCHLAYYNYKEGYEGEVPGLLVADNSSISPYVDTPEYDPSNPEKNAVSLNFGITNYQIYIISTDFMNEFPARVGSLKLGDWNTFSPADFKLIVYRWNKKQSHYTLWTDFAFNYALDTTDGKWHTTASDSTDPKDDTSYANFIATMKLDNNRKFRMKATAPATLKYTFINSRKYQWLTTNTFTAEIPLIILLKDLPAFNSMDIFERPFGDITLKMMFGPRSMVIFSDLQKCKQHSSSDFNITDFTITNLTCECYGYNLNDEGSNEEAFAPIKSKFGPNSDRSRIYEARFTDFKNFDGNMEGGRFNIEFPGALEMVKSIHMTFPRSSSDMTVFRNPFLRDVKLKLDGILYPREENLRTDNRMFYHLQAQDNDLDDDIKYSYTCPALNKAKTARLADSEKKEDMDDSNFIITWDLAVGHFMAMHRYSDNVNINFTAEIIHFLHDMYGTNASGTGGAVDYNNNEPSPQIWFTHDSCWRLNLRDGLTFMKQTCPSFDLYNSNGEDVYYMK